MVYIQRHRKKAQNTDIYLSKKFEKNSLYTGCEDGTNI